MMNEKVKSIMTNDPITITKDDSIGEASRVLKKFKIEHLPVIDDNRKLIGIISFYDLWECKKCYSDYDNIKVGEVMTKNVVKLHPEDKVGSVAEIFLENLFEAIPIVDDSNTLIGIVTMLDIVWYEYKKEYPRHFGDFIHFKEYHMNNIK
ncbi:MAG: CBS domain-containing protein [Saprospiraceae bacterium]|nr:CBS domain-containing protein [Saprospiraceae bacterium]